MSPDIVEEYWKAITAIEAQEFLIQTKIASWPYMKKFEREKLHREMYDKAYPWNRKYVKPEDLLEVING